MFGRKNIINFEYPTFSLNRNMVFTSKSLITELLPYQSDDGSIRYIKSDITLMSEIGNTDNVTPAISDELRIRGTMRESTPLNNLSDSEIVSSIKPRGIQSMVELERFGNFLDDNVKETLDKEKREELKEQYKKFLFGDEEQQVEPSKTE